MEDKISSKFDGLDNYKKKYKFPCISRGSKYVTLWDCQDCPQNNTCDIYATMLNEDLDED